MRRLVTLLVLFTLVVAGAPKSGPTIAVSDCTTSGNGCAAGMPFTLSGDGYSDRKLYVIEGFSPENPGDIYVANMLTPDANGNLLVQDAHLPAGTWCFTVFMENHNATPRNKELATTTVVFE